MTKIEKSKKWVDPRSFVSYQSLEQLYYTHYKFFCACIKSLIIKKVEWLPPLRYKF